ncbi:YdcF family protein [Porphyromonas canoris]|uniref:YdcF family protein n=1 Tax=Porphyromonas canoris TaxID=36875 RepID=UPI00068F2EE2|nr:YdcF family protein [Porphyromonas canoris]
MATRKKKIMAILGSFFSLLSIIVVLPLFGHPEKPQSFNDKFDVIIVLGNAPNKDCSPSSIMKQRVLKGVSLWKKGTAKHIIFSGGESKNNCIESILMHKMATDLGVPDSCIITEKHSKNTYQNAFFSVEEMKKNNAHTAAIVTSNFHRKRVAAIFSNYDIEYRIYICDSSDDQLWLWKLREHIILLYHTLFGYSSNFGLEYSSM